MKMNSQQFALFQKQLANVIKNSAFYQKKFAGLDPASIRTQEDFETLPFTSKGDLREAYPLGLQGVPDKDSTFGFLPFFGASSSIWTVWPNSVWVPSWASS